MIVPAHRVAILRVMVHIPGIDVVRVFEEFLNTRGPVIREIVPGLSFLVHDVIVADLLEG